MQRASTISGRLQTKDNKNGSSGSDTESLPQTESDKENWEPNQHQLRRRQPAHTPGSQRSRRVLGENTEIMSQSTSLGNMLARAKGNTPSKGGRKGSDPEQDEELRLFMNSADSTTKTAVSSAEEAGCVEGLLKLSQGQWKWARAIGMTTNDGWMEVFGAIISPGSYSSPQVLPAISSACIAFKWRVGKEILGGVWTRMDGHCFLSFHRHDQNLLLVLPPQDFALHTCFRAAQSMIFQLFFPHWGGQDYYTTAAAHIQFPNQISGPTAITSPAPARPHILGQARAIAAAFASIKFHPHPS
jgi:hypothetical protein